MSRFRRSPIPTVAALLLLGASLALASGTAGSLDSTFDGDGVVVTTMNPYGQIRDVATQSDGKIVAVGSDRWNHATEAMQWAVHRYDLDGSLDNDFGSDGCVTLFGDERDDQAYAAAIDGDGKILVAGCATKVKKKGKKTTTEAKGALVRLTSSGALDATFATDGVAYVLERAHAVAVDGDGYIVGGSVTVSARGKKSRAFALARFDADGDLDTTFGDDGIVVHDLTKASSKVLGSGDDTLLDLAIDGDGRIFVIGESSDDGFSYDNDQWLLCYESDGDLDTAFGSNGMVKVGVSPDLWLWGLAIDGSDRPVVSGWGNDPDALAFVARYGTSGSPDTTFGTNGVFTLQTMDGLWGGDVAIQGDGKIVVSADVSDGSQTDVTVFRLTAGGALDGTFGTSGLGDAGGDATNHDSAFAIRIDANGDIVLGGSTLDSGGSPSWLVVRYCGG